MPTGQCQGTEPSKGLSQRNLETPGAGLPGPLLPFRVSALVESGFSAARSGRALLASTRGSGTSGGETAPGRDGATDRGGLLGAVRGRPPYPRPREGEV